MQLAGRAGLGWVGPADGNVDDDDDQADDDNEGQPYWLCLPQPWTSFSNRTVDAGREFMLSYIVLKSPKIFLCSPKWCNFASLERICVSVLLLKLVHGDGIEVSFK